MVVQPVSPSSLQRQTLLLYGELLALREHWGGKLVLCGGPGVSATGLAAAVSIAGGTTLVVDPDVSTVKRVFRDGGLDFVVNTLDEALRTLKNEVRKGQPLGIGLTAEFPVALGTMSVRGVLPDLFVDFDGTNLEVECIARLSPQTSAGEAEASEISQTWLSYREWSSHEIVAGEGVAMSRLESALREVIPEADLLRRKWLQQIAQYQRSARAGSRWIWLTSDERKRVDQLLEVNPA